MNSSCGSDLKPNPKDIGYLYDNYSTIARVGTSCLRVGIAACRVHSWVYNDEFPHRTPKWPLHQILALENWPAGRKFPDQLQHDLLCPAAKVSGIFP